MVLVAEVSNEIKNALENDEAVQPLFNKYYDTMLKPMGVKPLKV